MEDFELVGPNGTDINNEFLKQYRDALRDQYYANVSSLKQEKRNADASIMSAANERGMMYSNFPQRAKIQNEANYLKNAADLHTTYQTGLDKLRSNAVGTYNQIKDLEDKIADLNEYASKPKRTDPTNTNPFNTPLGNNNNGTDKYNKKDIASQTDKLNNYTDAGWSSSAWDEQVDKSNGKYTDWVIFPDWLERGAQTGQWYFGNNPGKG